MREPCQHIVITLLFLPVENPAPSVDSVKSPHMYYLYLLYSDKNKQYYVGTAADLKKRFYTHNSGENQSTKSGIPWRLIYYEAYPTKVDALDREYKLKRYGQALRQLKARITLVDPR